MTKKNTFSAISENRLATCRPELQALLREVLEVMDFTVICGHRSNEAQAVAYREGNSELKPGRSKHNLFPSAAVDIAPYYPGGIRWTDKEAACLLAGMVKGMARRRGLTIRWGGDWDNDNDRQDQKALDDLWHFELVD